VVQLLILLAVADEAVLELVLLEQRLEQIVLPNQE
jgi:hypothetical protein